MMMSTKEDFSLKILEEGQSKETEYNNEIAMFKGDFNRGQLSMIKDIAKAMASSSLTVPAHLKGNVGDCFAIAMQAARWSMDPFVVASKTYVISGKLSYEAQLVAAVALSSGKIKGRFHYEYKGVWTPSSHGEVRCGATFNNEEEMQWCEWIDCSKITIKNSPLWKQNPKQQASYFATRSFVRLFMPEVLLGVYVPEELQDYKPNSKISLNDILEKNIVNPQEELESDKEV